MGFSAFPCLHMCTSTPADTEAAGCSTVFSSQLWSKYAVHTDEASDTCMSLS